ncbi:MAG TPA: hypothetical protein VJH24_01485 [Candidatus Bilamarchaeaceae archaeon]|nr:hypothetical protein [Candidatus Bilamarchaeaceae archaeon]
MVRAKDKRLMVGMGLIAAFLFIVTVGLSVYESQQPREALACEHVQAVMPLFNLLPILSTFGVVVGMGAYYIMSQKIETKEETIKKSGEVILRFLDSDEKKVVSRLLGNHGKVLQAEITRMDGMSKVKSHRVVKRMLKKGVIEVEGFGKTNIVKLPQELWESLVN